MGLIDMGFFLDLSPARLMIKIWEYSYHVHHFPPPDATSCNCSLYLDLCIAAARELWDRENYIHLDMALFKFQFHRKQYMYLLTLKNEMYVEQIVESILRGEI